MNQGTFKSPDVTDSPRFGHILASPVRGEESRSSASNPGRVPDLSFLSNNFSSDSLVHDDVSGGDWSLSHSAASSAFPYGSRRQSLTGSNSSLLNSPSMPVGRASFSHHQRAGSSASARPRPRSLLVADPAALWESEEAITDEGETTPSAKGSRHSQRAPSILPPAELLSPRSRSASPSRSSSPSRAQSSYKLRSGSPTRQPFNFKPQDLSLPQGSPAHVVKPAHRKGHRYKHSSVSMNLFQEPLPIADTNQQPNLIPDSYPIPNLSESMQSATPTQRFNLFLAVAHFATSIAVFLAGARSGQHAFSTLAHLTFYDSLGSFLVACVDIMSNFEVWSKPSIAYPFGLGRLEVLTGFALSTSSVMVGCDLVSHFVEETIVELVDPVIEKSVDHGSHHIHGSHGGPVDWLLYESVLVVVLLITWFTSICIFNKAPGIASAVTRGPPKDDGRVAPSLLESTGKQGLAGFLPENIRAITSVLAKNPIRLLTMTYSTFLLVVPLIPDQLKEEFGFDLNEVSTLVVALTLCYVGWSLVKVLGGILMISFPYSGYEYNVVKATMHDKILNLSSFKSSYGVSKLYCTKVNPQLYLAGVEVQMLGASVDDESRIVFEVNRIIASTIKEYEKDCHVETTISTKRT